MLNSFVKFQRISTRLWQTILNSVMMYAKPAFLMFKSTSLQQFITKLNDNQHQIVLRLRNTSAPTIFHVNKANYEPNTDRSQIPAFVEAVYPYPESKKFSKYAPILFPGGKCEDMSKLFRCQHLALVRALQYVLRYESYSLQMLRSILFGSSSLTSTHKLGGPKTMGDLWGVELVTPGAIALVSVLVFVHFSISKLNTLLINYTDHFPSL